MSRLETRTTEQKNDKKKRILIIVGLLLITLVATTAAFFWGRTDKSKPVTEVSGVHKKINILLMGINQRKNDIGRSNVTCVVTVDTDTKDVSMLWVPRDSRVKIPGHGWNKIGHAYAYDGPKLSEQTVADFLGVPIDYYVAINMSGFKNVIDALGGVDINVDKRMYYYDPYDEGEVDNNGLIDLNAGMQHMDGNTALQYVRFRHDEMGDIGRIERQQKFAKALLADIITPSIITKIPNVIKEANSVFATDMPVGEMLSVAKIITDAYKKGLNTDMVSGKPIDIEEINYWVPDVMAMRKQIAQIMGLVVDDKYLAAARKLAGEYEASIPRETKVADVPSVVPKGPTHPDKQTTTAIIATNTPTNSKPLPINNKPKTDNASDNGQKVPPNSTISGESTEGVRKNTVVNTTGK